MYILKKWVWPVVAGFIVASIIMVAFEWINHFLFPLPANLDVNDIAAVHAFTASLPWTVYILVFLGWAAGSFVAGYVCARLAGEKQFSAVAILTVLLVLAGIADMLMIGFLMPAMILGVVVLAVFPYLGRYAFNAFQTR